MKIQAIRIIKLTRTLGILTLLMLIAPAVSAGDSPKSFYENGIHLNPDCKIKRMSNGEIIVIAQNPEGTEVMHKFNGFYADLLLAAYRKQRVELMVDIFSKKYYLSQDECRREIKHAVNVLADWNIVLREEQMALR